MSLRSKVGASAFWMSVLIVVSLTSDPSGLVWLRACCTRMLRTVCIVRVEAPPALSPLACPIAARMTDGMSTPPWSLNRRSSPAIAAHLR